MQKPNISSSYGQLSPELTLSLAIIELHQRKHRVVSPQHFERSAQLVAKLLVQCVVHLGPVQAQEGNAVCSLQV
jgi:hypothetical protein